jgi:hypothetical protein
VIFVVQTHVIFSCKSKDKTITGPNVVIHTGKSGEAAGFVR